MKFTQIVRRGLKCVLGEKKNKKVYDILSGKKFHRLVYMITHYFHNKGG